MTAKTRGSKRRKTEEKKIDLNEKNKKEKVLRTKEGGEERQRVDEEDRRLKSEEESLKLTLHDLKVEHDRERASLSNLEKEMAKLKRTIDECLKKEENLEEDVKRAQKKLDLVQQRMIQRKLPPLPKEIYFEVAKHVHKSEALAFAMTCRASRDAMKEALKAREGNIGTSAIWLRTRGNHYMETEGVPVSEEWIKWAFSLKWEYAKERSDNEKEKGGLLTYLAGRGGYKDVLLWLEGEGCVLDEDTCSGAAEGGHIDVLKYLKSEGMAFDSDTCYYAAQGGHLKVLKYFRSEGVTFDSETCEAAAEGGHIKVLKYLKSEGVPFDWLTCAGAARGGHIEVLKYLKSEGMAFDSETCEGAAWRGHLEALKWLRSEEVNCPWDMQECLYQAMEKGNGDEEMNMWIASFLID